MLIPTCPPFQSFAKLPLRRREAILQYWATSPIPLLPKVCMHDVACPVCLYVAVTCRHVCAVCCSAAATLGTAGTSGRRYSAGQVGDIQSCYTMQAFKGIKSLICSTIFSTSDGKGGNPMWPAIGYAGASVRFYT